ncbi:MAG: hypothetical protein WC979_04210 [Candidatus Pacearchaeota archaeon]
MDNYITEFFQKAYEFISPEYARNKRMTKFEALVESGELEGMCSSEVHNLFRIKRISNEF